MSGADTKKVELTDTVTFPPDVLATIMEKDDTRHGVSRPLDNSMPAGTKCDLPTVMAERLIRIGVAKATR